MTDDGCWVTRGFAAFRAGTFGNAGQNLYVSRAGVLQRIHQFDIDRDGYIDLIFCCSQDHWENPPAYLYTDPLGSDARIELPAEGAWSGAVGDLNGDGRDELVVGMHHNGVRSDLNAVIYYNTGEGMGECRQQKLPVPTCTSVAIGDFNDDGRPDLAFLSDGKVRLFYQSALGFEPKRFEDLPITGDQLTAGDLDGDGYAELIIRTRDGRLRIYWGGPYGIDPASMSDVPMAFAAITEAQSDWMTSGEFVEEPSPLPRILDLHGVPHLFAPGQDTAALFPVHADRSFGEPLLLACRHAMSAAVGDIKGSGSLDLVIACREPHDGGECSWIYWDNPRGYRDDHRTPLPSRRACDVAVGDLRGDGCADIVLCQSFHDDSFTGDSLIYRSTPEGVSPEPVRLLSHDARRVFLLPSADGRRQVALVNHFARNKIGNIPIRIYPGGPDGYAPDRCRLLPAWGAVEAVCCDLTDTGTVDLVLANASENAILQDPGSFIYYQGPAGFPAAPSLVLPTQHAHGICCADINRDGCLDLIFCGFSSDDLIIYYGTPDGFDLANPVRIRLEHDGVLYREARWIYLADLNNDGWLDLVVPQITADRSFILWGGPEGFNMERCQVLSVERAACARAADLTGNGYLDLIMGGHIPSADGPHDSFVYIYWNGPDGLREDRRMLLPARGINALSVADFNNDGLLDIYVGSYSEARERDIDSYIYWNKPGHGFTTHDRTRLFTHSASGCLAADFNEDGWIDLAVANHKCDGDHVGASMVWWNSPRGFNEERVTWLPAEGPHGMVSAEPGNQLDRGPEEYYISQPLELPEGHAVTRVGWQAEVPEKTWVRAQLRCADNPALLEDAAWVGPDGAGSWFANEQDVPDLPGRWVQYRLALGAVNSLTTPRISEVAMHHSAVAR